MWNFGCNFRIEKEFEEINSASHMQKRTYEMYTSMGLTPKHWQNLETSTEKYLKKYEMDSCFK